jgi:hypothetical protein
MADDKATTASRVHITMDDTMATRRQGMTVTGLKHVVGVSGHWYVFGLFYF